MNKITLLAAAIALTLSINCNADELILTQSADDTAEVPPLTYKELKTIRLTRLANENKDKTAKQIANENDLTVEEEREVLILIMGINGGGCFPPCG